MNLLQRDQVVGQRYQLIERLGEGGMGEVWSATHVVTRKPVAIKFLKKHEKASVNEQLSLRFIREARAASAIHHPNVVEVHDVLQHDDGMPMMVMDLLRGRTLSSLLEIRPLLPNDAATILLPIVSAVGTAHALGIVHRDLKPDNLFLAQLGDGRVEPKVLDFGIAKIALDDGQSAGLTATGSMLGTPYYMSPEQMFGEKNIDGRSDVWSLGVIMYECLGGVRPFDGENLGQLMKAISGATMTPLARLAPQTPPDMVAMVERMLKVDRNQRPNIDEVHAFLHGYSQARDSSRISVRHLPPAMAQMATERTSVLTPTPQTGPGYPPRQVTGPQPMQPMLPPNTGPYPQYRASPMPMPSAMPMQQTGPRTPAPMSNSQFGAGAMPSTLSGAATSQALGPSMRPQPSGAPMGAVVAVVGVVMALMAVVGVVLIVRSRSHETAHGADAQPSATVQVVETATAPTVSVALPTPVESASEPPPLVADAGVKVAMPTTPPGPALVPTGGPAPAPLPKPKPNSKTTTTTVPGGVSTTVPF